MTTGRIVPLAILTLTLVWYAGLVLRFPTHGVIGDDPATYVQMGVDLARSGKVTHEFPLFTNFLSRNLSWDAFITPGYHIVRETSAIAPNFSFGLPLVLAFVYRLFGENALYRVTPLMGGIALVATFALANELWRTLPATRRYWTGALAALLLATTPKQIQLALVPMSDVPTQLFCVLAMWCALRVAKSETTSRRGVNFALAALCGLCLGVAYLMRQSALVMLVPLAIVSWRWGGTRRERLLLLFTALVLFGAIIAPDFFYRATVLDNVFAVSSPESAQFVLLDAPRQLGEMVGALFSVTGIGPVVILALLLAFRWNDPENRFAVSVLGTWILAFMVFHAPLRLTGVFENNLRYLVPAYPAIALLVARGLMLLFDWGLTGVRSLKAGGSSPIRAGLGILGAITGVILFLAAVRALAGPERFVARAYGWMSETARHDLDALNEQLPRDAVIGVSDQMAGAAMLYGGRAIFRPAYFVDPGREFPIFLADLKAEGRPVYLLGDWNCSPTAGASEKLPGWLAGYEMRDEKLEIGDLPYECAQLVREIK